MTDFVNLFDSKSLDDVSAYITTGGALDNSKLGQCQEFEYASYADIQHAPTWKHPHFNYFINRYGFRTTDNIPDEIDLAAYGCSFTYGLGLPEYMLWHKLLSKKLNKVSMNFGLNGASIETIANIFYITSKHIKNKQAIFLLPSYDRCQIAARDVKTKSLGYISLIPNFIPVLAKQYGLEGDMIYKYIPDEERIKVFINSVYLIDYVAKNRGIKVYFSSWESNTHELLQSLKFTNSLVLPAWRSIDYEQSQTDLARDNLHPGPEHHQQFVDWISEYIK